ncbi:hypothetical protein QEH42_gp054 [Microbacterium phage Pumpernickel]|uniref:Uncharacterized protein n=1 Tax=Microbacterium phage Pumpernickel TaxID=2885983 RepID=A0AAE8Y718_9CAUD|nr:hypothetical protein QEH42_gp054 [Microbacterium phage Pumpernickel]UDL15845.1 hypothetical protein SEA_PUMPERNICKEL_54 [Microbacterium phage Pumpernickel]
MGIRIGIECGQSLWRLRSWSPRRFNWKTRKWEYRWVGKRSGLIRWWDAGNHGEPGVAVGPIMVWKTDNRAVLRENYEQ